MLKLVHCGLCYKSPLRADLSHFTEYPSISSIKYYFQFYKAAVSMKDSVINNFVNFYNTSPWRDGFKEFEPKVLTAQLDDPVNKIEVKSSPVRIPPSFLLALFLLLSSFLFHSGAGCTGVFKLQ